MTINIERLLKDLEEVQSDINDLHKRDESPDMEKSIEVAYKALDEAIAEIEWVKAQDNG